MTTICPSAGWCGAPAATSLEHETSANWDRVALRDALKSLADLHQLHIFLDRRIDPDAIVSGEFRPTTLRKLIAQVGEKHGFGVTTLDGVVYLGPPATIDRLRTDNQLRIAQARSLGGALGGSVLAADRLAWSDLATPRELVEQVCQRARISISNPQRVPHDLWAANQLPDLPRVTQLSILLAGFDLTFDIDEGSVLTIRAKGDYEPWEQVYALPRRGGEQLLDHIQRERPNVKVTVSQNRFQVSGRIEDHESIREWLRSGLRNLESDPRPVRPQNQARVYTLRVVRRPLKDVLQELEKSTEYRFKISHESLNAAAISLDVSISFEVNQVEIDDLLTALLEPAGLSFQRVGNTIEVFADEDT